MPLRLQAMSDSPAANVPDTVYAALEGAALGGISYIMEQQYPGIVSQAVFLTSGGHANNVNRHG